MKLEARPDPQNPHGGHALLVVTSAKIPNKPTDVVIQQVSDGRYLGPAGWQAPVTAAANIVPIQHGRDAIIKLGPAIVDHIEEFSRLRVSIGENAADVIWPDDILVSPRDAAPDGGLRPIRQEASDTVSPPIGLTGAAAISVEKGVEEDLAPKIIKEEPQPPSRLRRGIAASLLAMLLVAVVIWFLPVRDGAPPEIVNLPPPSGPAVPARCTREWLATFSKTPTDDVIVEVRECDSRKELLDSFLTARIASKDAVALELMGRWYDPAEAESSGSLLSERDVVRALDYYSRAEQAGSTSAASLVQVACGALDPSNLLHEDAFERHCETE